MPQQATLWSPDGRSKVIIDVGSSNANKLLAAGWALGTGHSGTEVSMGDALATLSGTDSGTNIDWTTAYGGRFSHLKDNPERAAELAAQYEATGSTTGNTGNDAEDNTEQDDEQLLNEIYKDIDEQAQIEGWSAGQIATLKMIAQGNDYSNKVYNIKELTDIVERAAVDADANLEGYYERMKTTDIEDLKNSFADIRAAASAYKENEQVAYDRQLATTKKNLRARGLTFSGQALQTLGAESALKTEHQKDSEGNIIKGDLATDRERSYNQKIQEWQRSGRDLATAGSRLLGSDALSGVNKMISTPYGSQSLYNGLRYIPTSESERALQRLKERETATWESVGKYRPYTNLY